MAKLNSPMTAEAFQQVTGYTPTQDDLERVNCPEVGCIGHTQCGWNFVRNCPMFENSHESLELGIDS